VSISHDVALNTIIYYTFGFRNVDIAAECEKI